MVTNKQFNQGLEIMAAKMILWALRPNDKVPYKKAYKDALAEIKATVFSESETPKKD